MTDYCNIPRTRWYVLTWPRLFLVIALVSLLLWLVLG